MSDNRIMSIGVEQHFDSSSPFDWRFYYRFYGMTKVSIPMPTYEDAIESMIDFIKEPLDEKTK